MERVKRNIVTIHILLAAILMLLTTCKRDERDNPWDKFAAINPDTWAPKAVQTSNIDITKHEVAWTYEGDNRIEGFRIDRKEGNSEWEIGVFTAEKDDRSWIDTNVIPDTTLTYTYKVYAIAGDNKSSNIIASIDVEFPAPTSIDIEKISDISYKLSWADNSIGEQGFKIDRRTDGSEWQIAYGIVDANQTAYVDTNVFVRKSTYPVEYRVYAYFESYESAQVLVNTDATITPPTNLTITNNSITSVTLNWQDNSTGEDGFKVERKHGEGTWQQIATTTSPTFNDTNFELNTQVYYRVNAYAGQYNSSYAENDFDSNIPSPTNLLATSSSLISLDLNWDYSHIGHQGFKIDRKVNDGIWEQEFASVSNVDNSYTDNAVNLESSNYTYRIYAYFNQNNSAYAEEYVALSSVSTEIVTSITAHTAISGGNIADAGSSPVTARGVVWSTSENPTVESNLGITSDGTGAGTFTSNLTSLAPNTTYYVRSYATNSVGISYGNEQPFTTLDGIITINTTAVSGITATSAVSGGNITSDGGASVTARGVVWSTNQNPTTISNQGITSNGTGTGSWVSELVELTEGTTYYVRAYATNEAGTAYGEEKSFTTLTLPTLTTAEISNLASTSITTGGNITSDGGAAVTARGVCWGTVSNPTLENNFTEDGSGVGEFVSNLTGLTPTTTYYIRAYATSLAGTAYGNEVTFNTISTTQIADIDNNVYNTVTIGEQEWMAENLRTTKYKDDTTIPTGHTDSQWESLTTGAYAIYPHTEIEGLNSDAEVLEAYGALYNWYAVNTGNLCPTGWHVPTDAEWTALTDYVGGASTAGTKLKATSGWNSGGNGTDEYGFSALPGGGRYDGTFGGIGYGGYWWSATEGDTDYAWGRGVRYNLSSVGRYYNDKELGFSVRCLRD